MTFNIIFLMLRIDIFMKFWILHCFYHYFSNEINLVHIYDVMTNVDILLVLPLLLNRPAFEFYVNFGVVFSRAPDQPAGRPKGIKWALKALPGSPMIPKGRSKVVNLWNPI